MSAVTSVGTSPGGRTIFSRLDVSEVQLWIDEYVLPGEVWGITGRHVSFQSSDPVTLSQVEFTDFSMPASEYSIIRVIDYPGSTSDGTSVDFNHPDLTLVQLAVPEPASMSILSVVYAAIATRRRRAA